MYLLMYILEGKQKQKQKQNKTNEKKNKSLNFAESNAHRKTNARGSFKTYIFLFSFILSISVKPQHVI